jgi:DNA-binding response OmpR family regulator
VSDSSDLEVFSVGELLIQPSNWSVTARGQVLSLSRREFELLLVLVQQPGRIVLREDLHRLVWGTPYVKNDRSVDVYVHKIRTKLGEVTPDYEYIHTHFGIGYRFQPERSQNFHKTATTR